MDESCRDPSINCFTPLQTIIPKLFYSLIIILVVSFWGEKALKCSCQSSEWSSAFWPSALFGPRLCRPVKQMSDELELGLPLPPAVPKRAMSVLNGRRTGGREEKKINLPFTQSSLVRLLSCGRVKPNGAASYTKRKVKSINEYVCGLIQLCKV